MRTTKPYSKDNRKSLFYTSLFLILTLVLFYLLGPTYNLLIAILILLLIFLGLTFINHLKEFNQMREMLEASTREKRSYNKFIEDLPISILYIRNNQIEYINDRCLQLLGASSKDVVIGKSFFDFVPIDYWKKFAREHTLPSGNKGGYLIGKIKNFEGEYIDVNINYHQVNVESGKAFGIIIKDITKMKENEKKLQHSEQLSVIGELAAGVAHEIRNPLTSIKGFLQLMGDSDAKTASYKEIMNSELDRINLIVNELLLLSKPKEFDFQPKSITNLVNTVVTIASTQAILHNIEIITKFDKSVEHVQITCEENKLKQVFLNLLKNAMEAMEKEGQIFIHIVKAKDEVQISFMDQGVGIPKEKLENLGKRFYTTKEQGTGLGLMISMNIVREHGGDMIISSEEGVGTTIDVILPIEEKKVTANEEL